MMYIIIFPDVKKVWSAGGRTGKRARSTERRKSLSQQLAEGVKGKSREPVTPTAVTGFKGPGQRKKRSLRNKRRKLQEGSNIRKIARREAEVGD